MAKSRQSPKIRKLKVGSVILSSRVRLARNVRNRTFPDWSKPEERKALSEELSARCIEAGRLVSRDLESWNFLGGETDRVSSAVRDSLETSRLLSDCGECSAFVYDSANNRVDERFSVMINEEDHLRIQSIVDGYALDRAFASVDAFDSALGSFVEYAFSSRLGFLTACPSNVGTGLRASVEVYLPALLLLNEFDAVERAVTSLKFNFRGLSGEGSPLNSGRVQISTGGTLGLSESQAIASLKRVVDEVVRLEENARHHILTYRPFYLYDYVSRAIAILSGSYLICYDEAVSCMQAIRLGLELGVVKGISLRAFSVAMRSINIGSIKQMMTERGLSGKDFSLREVPASCAPNRYNEEFDSEDAFRSQFLREVVSKISFTNKDYL